MPSASAQMNFLDAVPAAVPVPIIGDRHGLRPYQREGVGYILDQWRNGSRAVPLSLFTGGGKTRTACATIAELPGRGLWLAMRDFLLDDAMDRVFEVTGHWPSLEKADSYSDGGRIVVGSVQSLKGKRLEAFRPDRFDWIVFDECHHAVAKSCRAIFDHFPKAIILGLSATLKRADKIGLWNVFDAEPFVRDVDWGRVNGYFVEPLPVSRLIDSIDLAKVGTVAGDLNLGQLEEAIARNAAAIAHIAAEECGDRPALIYTPGRASAHAVADTLNQMRPGSARSVDMNTPREERKKALREFGRSFQYIANCQIYTEGLDVPNARAIVIARPTQSWSLYVQMAGRGGRPEGWIGQLDTIEERLSAIRASTKPNFLLLDITGHPGRHSLVTAAKALAGKAVPDAVKNRADELLRKSKQPKTLGAALTEAAQMLADEDKAQREKIAKAARAAEVKARRGTFDPFRRFGLDEPQERGQAPGWAAELATAADMEWMRHNKLLTSKVAQKLTRGTVQALRDQAKKWLRDDMASFRQRASLSRAGCPVNVRFATAKRMLDLWRPPWRQLTAEQIAACRASEPGEDG